VTGLDTNVLVRYLTQDDPAEAARASRVIDAAGPADLFISTIVVCELVWVLEACYRRKRLEIAPVLEQMLLSGQFAFEDKDLLWQALEDYRRGKGDMADYLIGRIAQQGGCAQTVTFDKGLRGERLFRLL
jgi:predicted nucleic-acid-binding protein